MPRVSELRLGSRMLTATGLATIQWVLYTGAEKTSSLTLLIFAMTGAAGTTPVVSMPWSAAGSGFFPGGNVIADPSALLGKSVKACGVPYTIFPDALRMSDDVSAAGAPPSAVAINCAIPVPGRSDRSKPTLVLPSASENQTVTPDSPVSSRAYGSVQYGP